MAKTKKDEKQKGRPCPYCEDETEGGTMFCQPCQVTFVECPSCNGLVATGVKICPHCGVVITVKK